jgi:hypothetical protein
LSEADLLKRILFVRKGEREYVREREGGREKKKKESRRSVDGVERKRKIAQ